MSPCDGPAVVEARAPLWALVGDRVGDGYLMVERGPRLAEPRPGVRRSRHVQGPSRGFKAAERVGSPQEPARPPRALADLGVTDRRTPYD